MQAQHDGFTFGYTAAIETSADILWVACSRLNRQRKPNRRNPVRPTLKPTECITIQQNS
eukprot:jgi/Botrbrau1/2145/Bobra.0093s0050.1